MANRKDLLSEAIADAKAVKETALANAKLALEEAFTPQLQSMISAKLSEESEESDDDDNINDDYDKKDEDLDSSDLGSSDNAEPSDDSNDSSDIENDDDLTEEEEEGEEKEAEPTTEEEEGEEMSKDDSPTDETMEGEEEEDDLDLSNVIKELEAELAGDSKDETYESEDDETHSTDEDMDSDEEEAEAEEDDMDADDEFDLDEVIATLKEMEDEDEKSKVEETEEKEDDSVKEELEEAYSTIESLQKTINEVNLLNAKLLYTNKLFRTFDLNEGQKVKVLENFDRTSSVREVKLVFSTIAENLNVSKKKRTVVKEGMASKPTKSSAPKKIISEGNDMAARWKKLAGLK
tara:strand:- start:605 stop:1651 length:1047 start_codon:yes stop_codon:yes gene_type:complete